MDDLGKPWGISSLLHQMLCIIWRPSVNLNLSHSPETPNSGQTRRFFVRVTVILRMTLKKNAAPLLCCFKLCASFYRHQWLYPPLQRRGVSSERRCSSCSSFKLELQSGNTQFGPKLMVFCPLWPWNLTDDLEKQYGASSMLLQALCIIS